MLLNKRSPHAQMKTQCSQNKQIKKTEMILQGTFMYPLPRFYY